MGELVASKSSTFNMVIEDATSVLMSINNPNTNILQYEILVMKVYMCP